MPWPCRRFCWHNTDCKLFHLRWTDTMSWWEWCERCGLSHLLGKIERAGAEVASWTSAGLGGHDWLKVETCARFHFTARDSTTSFAQVNVFSDNSFGCLERRSQDVGSFFYATISQILYDHLERFSWWHHFGLNNSDGGSRWFARVVWQPLGQLCLLGSKLRLPGNSKRCTFQSHVRLAAAWPTLIDVVEMIESDRNPMEEIIVKWRYSEWRQEMNAGHLKEYLFFGSG